MVTVRRDMEQTNTAWDKTYKTDNLLEAPNAGFREHRHGHGGGQGGHPDIHGRQQAAELRGVRSHPHSRASLGVIVPRSEIVRPVRESGKLVILVLAGF